MNIKNIYRTISSIGVDNTSEDMQFVSSSNRAAMIAGGISFPYIFIYYFIGNNVLVFTNIFFLFAYSTTLVFNKLHYYKFAKIFFIFLGYSHVTMISIYYGAVSGFDLYFYLMPVISIFIFPKNEKISMFIGVGLFFVFYFATQYFYTIIEPEIISPQIANFLYDSAIVAVLIFIVAFVYLFRVSSLNAEDELKKKKEFMQTLLDSQEQIIITSIGEKIITVNERFYDFFAVNSIEEFEEEYDVKSISELFEIKTPEGYLQKSMGRESWIDYVISRSFEYNHKLMIKRNDRAFVFSVTATKLPGDEGMKSSIFTDITEIENAKLEIEAINKHTKESIEYASLIQEALIPSQSIFDEYFSDNFTVWKPKDIVGGDIYLFEELRNKDEALLMLIDCTGHGVPGAFVTMLVKAIERQVIAKIENDKNIEVSPAWILNYFNRKMKTLLKQENADSISNAGFDGGIIYYNKREKIIKFAGAETPLFYVEDKELKTIKGSRHSIGYKKSDSNFKFTEHTIEVREGMQFYLTTDGYLDQNGGEKGFPFAKKRFKGIIQESFEETMLDQKEIFLNTLADYQGNEDTNDDITLVGFKI